MLAALGQFYENYIRLQDPSERMENLLRVMYGRGEISKERFFQLRFKLHGGQMLQGEIMQMHRDALRRMEAQGKLTGRKRHPEVARSLNRLYLDRALLEEARSEIEQAQKALAVEANWIKEEAESARQEAQACLPDEAEARAYLEVWQNLLQLSRLLDGRMEALRQGLRQIDALEAQIRAYITELKLLESQEHLTRLKLRIGQDFHV